MSRFASLMTKDKAQWSQPLQLIPSIENPAAIRPKLENLADWLECTDCVNPLLRVTNTPTFTLSILARQPDAQGHESPMVYLAKLLAAETLQELFKTLEAVFNSIAPPKNE